MDPEQKGPIDVAQEPVDLTQDDEYMDTGVLHEERTCVGCGDDLAAEGYAYCTECMEAGVMDADQRAVKEKKEKQ